MSKIGNLTLKKLFNITLFIWIIFIPMKTSFYQISYVLLIILFLVHLFTEKRFTLFIEMLKEYKSLLIAFSLIILSMTISNLLSNITTFLSWKTEFLYIFRYFLLFLILIFLHRENFFTKKFLLIAIFSSLLLQGLDGISQAIFNYDFIKGHTNGLHEGLSGAVFQKNPFGMFMAIGASLSFGLLFYKNLYKLKRIEMTLLSIFFGIFIFNLLFSYSRASWLFFAMFIIVLYVANYKNIDKRYIFILITVVLLIVIMFNYNEALLLRFKSLIHGDSSHRFEIWKQAISLIKQKIFFGYGLMTYSKIGLKGFSGVHNSIIEIFLFLGLFGFIVYTNLLLKILNKILSNKNIIQLGLFFAYIVITQFDESIIKSIVVISPLVLFSFFIFSQGKRDNAL